ncbi:hypothetical protein CN478_16005 [Bacillus cereus]|nr:hypothetical protein CON04_29455 [Bacillus cereus]PEC26654.1 hypothetical protein CON75_18415 [Bacillus thuringiensis]PEQ77093.1 hypothetical protein CN478_16005 [Bacillus cereus]PFZ17086.1 hypothetical protein COL73_25760 [Bacillus thuringiensis]
MKFISTIFQIYRSFLSIYQRFFKYIYRNLQYINDFLNISIYRQKNDRQAPPFSSTKKEPTHSNADSLQSLIYRKTK